MSTVVQPLGVKCNIRCGYCFQNPQRDAGNVGHRYDLERMKLAIEEQGGPFLLFGGEPLLMKEEDLEALWSWGYEKYGVNKLQTNGVLVNDRHIRLFKAYNVRVGISVDGPGELNDIRSAGSLERTRAATTKTHQAIARLLEEDISIGLIVVLHRLNAASDKLPRMHAWMRELDAMGLKKLRLHILESDDDYVRQYYALSQQENIEAFMSFLLLEKELSALRFDVFADIRNLLLGHDEEATCTWRACDPYTTASVQGVDGTGQRSNCDQANKEGISFVKTDSEGFERYVALYLTPQECGGCRGCRFFLMCRGQCPGTAIDGDWRNRSEYCSVWKHLFQHIEGELTASGAHPLSIDPKRAEVEERLMGAWLSGSNPDVADILQQARAFPNRSGAAPAVR